MANQANQPQIVVTQQTATPDQLAAPEVPVEAKVIASSKKKSKDTAATAE